MQGAMGSLVFVCQAEWGWQRDQGAAASGWEGEEDPGQARKEAFQGEDCGRCQERGTASCKEGARRKTGGRREQCEFGEPREAVVNSR